MTLSLPTRLLSALALSLGLLGGAAVVAPAPAEACGGYAMSETDRAINLAWGELSEEGSDATVVAATRLEDGRIEVEVRTPAKDGVALAQLRWYRADGDGFSATAAGRSYWFASRTATVSPTVAAAVRKVMARFTRAVAAR